MDVAAYAPAVQSIASELSGCGDILDARRQLEAVPMVVGPGARVQEWGVERVTIHLTTVALEWTTWQDPL